MTITAVGSIASGSPGSMMVSPTAGNVLVVLVEGSDPLSFGEEMTGISGGGVTVWHCSLGIGIGGLFDGANFDGQNGAIWLCWGTVTATGSAALNVTGTDLFHIVAQEFHSSTASDWKQVAADKLSNVSGASGNYPSLTGTSQDGLFVGFGCATSGTMGGSSSGFTYVNGLGSGQMSSAQMVYYLDTSSPNAYSPNSTWGSGLLPGLLSVIITPFGGSAVVMLV